MGETRFFVGNIPANTSEQDLQAEFGYYGVVNRVELKKKNDDEHFAFVNLQIEDRLVEKCEKTFMSFHQVINNFLFQAFASLDNKNSRETSYQYQELRKASSID